jgi:hypothetical protein
MTIGQSFCVDPDKKTTGQQSDSIFSKLFINLTHKQEGRHFLTEVDDPVVINRFKKMFSFANLRDDCRIIVTSFHLRFVK